MSMIPPRGGSDILEIGLRKRINFDEYDVNLILSRCTEDQIVDGKKNIVWQHLNYNEPLTQGMTNKFFTRAVDAWVYVSHWQHEKFRYVYHIPVDNAFVIKNAIDPIEYIERPKGEKIRLIYTSAPFRGLNILLDAFELLNRDDIELDVYSSTIVYGSGYDAAHRKTYEPLFERARNMKNVNYMGYAPNEEIIKALQRSHIFAYPSMFEETCCLAMIEAGAAGCKLVAHNLGALAETGSEFANLVPIRIDAKKIAQEYAKALNIEIENYWNLAPMLKQQSNFFNTFYSWDIVIKKWILLLQDFCSSNFNQNTRS
jgi:glycosyltransferase involved in cell wall biosynthesis